MAYPVRVRSTAAGVRVSRLSHPLDDRRRHRLLEQLHQRIAVFQPVRELAVRAPLGTEVGHDIDVVLYDGRDERIVHLFIANEMHDGVDVRVHELDGVGVIEHVGVDRQAMLVALVDDGLEKRWRQARRTPVLSSTQILTTFTFLSASS